jgi:bifunctional DNA-binding transcriptional regulator/antitoxin component of YhaV-PrlF toxin-antitoxin module
MNVKVSTRGRITIPIDIRPLREFGWTASTRLIVREADNRIVVMTFAQHVQSLRGREGLKALMQDRAVKMRE